MYGCPSPSEEDRSSYEERQPSRFPQSVPSVVSCSAAHHPSCWESLPVHDLHSRSPVRLAQRTTSPTRPASGSHLPFPVLSCFAIPACWPAGGHHDCYRSPSADFMTPPLLAGIPVLAQLATHIPAPQFLTQAIILLDGTPFLFRILWPIRLSHSLAHQTPTSSRHTRPVCPVSKESWL